MELIDIVAGHWSDIDFTTLLSTIPCDRTKAYCSSHEMATSKFSIPPIARLRFKLDNQTTHEASKESYGWLWLYRYRLQLEIVIVKTSSVLGYRWHKFRYFFFFFNPSYEGYSIPIQTDVSTFNGQTRNLFVRWIDLSLNVTRIRIENTRTRGLERRSERSNALWVRSKRKAVFARKEPGERRVEDN